MRARTGPGRRAAFSALAALPALATGARAQPAAAFPNRPLRLVSPFNPGGAVDVLNRVLAERLSVELGQPVVVDAKPGANTVVGAAEAARAAPDGHTFLVTTNSTHTTNPFLIRDLPYDPVRSFAPVTLLSLGTILLCAPAAATFTDVPGFLSWARARGRPATYGSWGVGSSAHLYGEMLRTKEGAPLEHVPYRGEQPAIADVLAGRLDATFASPVGAKPQQAAGNLRVLGIPSPRRSDSMPEVPTFAEQGLDGYDLSLFVAGWVPAGTPRAAVDRLRAAFAAAVSDPGLRRTMLDQGQTPVLSTPEELAATVARDTPRWAELLRLSGAKAE
jgi:tripartite-type tricarboxylate transporter receptor subunit TctC